MFRARFVLVLGAAALVTLSLVNTSWARNPIRRTFFNTYPMAAGTQLDDLPSNSGHCGVCHFDFNGGGPRNPYGASIEVGLNAGLSNAQAILAVEDKDADGDGFTNWAEITLVGLFGNTPTFPGLYAGNKNSTLNIPVSEIEGYLTPTGSTDTTPPAVSVSSPNGGESFAATDLHTVTFAASDANGIAHVNVYMSDDGGVTFKPVARYEPSTSSYEWFVPNRPGPATRIRVEAVDNAGNRGHDDSDASFTITGVTGGIAPTTLRDMDMPGTQPNEGAILEDADANCAGCHGNYDDAVEPWSNWRGGMMAQAARDPFFYACVAVAEQDAPGAGDLCIRCHSPGGWQEGRSVDTSGDMLTAKDRQGVQCDFCHRAVDFDYQAGVSPIEDVEVLAGLAVLPSQYGNGQFINDPSSMRRGPYADANASHAFLDSPFHRSADMCGTCHDVSSPVFAQDSPGDYVPTTFDQEHPDMDIRNMFPVERTFSEWSQSAYASGGVYAPQFAGDKPDGIVSTCQDCHMADVTGKGCNEPGAPTRSDLALHDQTGGNTFVPDILAGYFPDEVDPAQLSAAKARAVAMIQKAATLEVTAEDFGVSVRVTNETGHKLPSGYPEGRRVWLHVRAVDGNGTQVFESGAYDLASGILAHDEHLKIYEIHPGLSPALAGALNMPAGPSFHFVLSDTVYTDTRIPPRGFTNAGFEAVQSPPVAYSYADGQYWDDTDYVLPTSARSAIVTLYYQTTSKEYIEFLRDANTTNSAGDDLYDAWVAQGKAPPVAIATTTVAVAPTVGVPGAALPLAFALDEVRPNPFRGRTTFHIAIPRDGPVRLTIHDASGRVVRTLLDRTLEAGRYAPTWDGRDATGQRSSPGVYFARMHADGFAATRKVIHLR